MFENLQLLAIGPTGWGDEILLGAWLTIRLAFATLPVGLALGFLVALAKRSESKLAARVRRGLFDHLPRAARASYAFHHLLRRPVPAADDRAPLHRHYGRGERLHRRHASRSASSSPPMRARSSPRLSTASRRAVGGREGGRPAPMADHAARHHAAASADRAARPRQSLARSPEGHGARLRHRPRTISCA